MITLFPKINAFCCLFSKLQQCDKLQRRNFEIEINVYLTVTRMKSNEISNAISAVIPTHVTKCCPGTGYKL